MIEMAKGKVVSFTNFNPIALFAVCLLLLGLILAAVGTGLTHWGRFETKREFPDDARSTVSNGRTFKTQGLLTRCIEYEYGQELLDLGLPSSSLPQAECLSMTDLDCSYALQPLISALDLLNHAEIHNTDSTDRCIEMKIRLNAAATFMILGVIATFVSLILFFPFFHWKLFIVGSAISFASVILLIIGIGVFGGTDQDFAGFFSIEGGPSDGCLSYGFGVALASLFVNVIATIVGVVSIFYHKMKALHKSGKQN
jgi:hypothetical protein